MPCHRAAASADGDPRRADASHELVKELDRLASRHGYQVTWSVGWALGKRRRLRSARSRVRLGNRHRRQGPGPRTPRRRGLPGLGLTELR
jgi:hypothetical protein